MHQQCPDFANTLGHVAGGACEAATTGEVWKGAGKRWWWGGLACPWRAGPVHRVARRAIYMACVEFASSEGCNSNVTSSYSLSFLQTAVPAHEAATTCRAAKTSTRPVLAEPACLFCRGQACVAAPCFALHARACPIFFPSLSLLHTHSCSFS
eukprot:scaffold44951_cov20-Tisochrysis_lutea.AAC.1